MLPYIQSCTNPVIYSFMSRRFRRRLWLTWRRIISLACCCCWRCCSWPALDGQRVDQRMVALDDFNATVRTNRNVVVRVGSYDSSQTQPSRYSFATAPAESAAEIENENADCRVGETRHPPASRKMRATTSGIGRDGRKNSASATCFSIMPELYR